jgi:hypothetical protein
LQIGAFFGNDRAFDGTNLETNAAVDAGGEVDPVPVGAFGIFAGALVDAGDWAGIYAVGNAFAGVGENRVCHESYGVMSDGL